MNGKLAGCLGLIGGGFFGLWLMAWVIVILIGYGAL